MKNKKDDCPKWMAASTCRALQEAGLSVQDPKIRQLQDSGCSQAARNLYCCWYARLSRSESGRKSLLKERKLAAWRHSKEFDAFARQWIQEYMEKFRMAGMVCVMSMTLVFYFAWAVFRSRYIVSFSIDALVAAVALAFGLVNGKNMLDTVHVFGSRKEFYVTDLLACILCLLLKMFVPAQFDASLPVLVLAYFLEKRRFAGYQQNLASEIGISLPQSKKTVFPITIFSNSPHRAVFFVASCSYGFRFCSSALHDRNHQKRRRSQQTEEEWKIRASKMPKEPVCKVQTVQKWSGLERRTE